MSRRPVADVIPLRRVAGEVHELTDEALVSAAGAGDPAALGALFDRFSLDLFRFITRLAGRFAADVDDLVQATFIEVYRSSARFTRDSSVKTWMFGIAINVARHHRRSEGRRNAHLERFAGMSAAPGSPRPDQLTERARQLSDVARALDQIDEPLRVAYVLCVVEEMTAREAAQAVGVSEGTIWRRVHEARAALREHLPRRGP